MIRAVLDTNVLASGILNREGPSGQILLAWEVGAFTLVMSTEILAELADVLTRPYFQTRLTQAEREAYLALLETETLLVLPTSSVAGITPDPDDDVVLATAVAGHAAYLVTGDKAFLSTGLAAGVTILPPRDFLGVLDPQDLGR